MTAIENLKVDNGWVFKYGFPDVLKARAYLEKELVPCPCITHLVLLMPGKSEQPERIKTLSSMHRNDQWYGMPLLSVNFLRKGASPYRPVIVAYRTAMKGCVTHHAYHAEILKLLASRHIKTYDDLRKGLDGTDQKPTTRQGSDVYMKTKAELNGNSALTYPYHAQAMEYWYLLHQSVPSNGPTSASAAKDGTLPDYKLITLADLRASGQCDTLEDVQRQLRPKLVERGMSKAEVDRAKETNYCLQRNIPLSPSYYAPVLIKFCLKQIELELLDATKDRPEL